MKTYAEDLQTPVIIDHLTFLGTRQTKRVDRIDFGVEAAPEVLAALRITPNGPDSELIRLVGDTVNADGTPMGEIRGWQTYVYSDDVIDVVRQV